VRRRLVAAGAVVALLAGGCTTETAPPTIRVGLLTALSGTQQAPGADIRQGFLLYLETHGNALGGREVELFTADEGEDATTSGPAAEKLIEQNHVQVLAGTISSGASGGVASVATREEIPFVGANGRPKIDDTTWVWHTSFLTEDFGAALGRYMAEEIAGPVYVMGQDFLGAYEGMRGFLRAFRGAGGVLANENGEPALTPMSTQDYQPFLAGIGETGARAVYGWYVAKQGVDFLKQYHVSAAAGLPLYGSGATEGTKALPAIGDAAIGVRSAFHYAPDLDNPANRAFVAAWDAKYPGVVPSGLAVSAYDAGAVLDQAIAAAGPDASPAAVNRAIAGLGKIDSPRGEWEFGPQTHTPVQKWYLREVRRDGRALSNAVIQDLVTLGN
jgi:branched-chain amino acid transport system substrate-binding protein